MACDITPIELWKIINLHKNAEDLKQIIETSESQVITNEYYFINIGWVEKFQKIFHYKGIIDTLTKKLKDLRKLEKPPKISNLPKVFMNDKNEIRIIRNGDIIRNLDESSSYCFPAPFCLIDPQYYYKIIDGYFIDEKVKYDISICNGMFMIDLSNNTIEVGVFESPYTYNALYIFKFRKGVDYNKEKDDIFSRGFINYLYQFEITNDILTKENKILGKKFELIKLYLKKDWKIPVKNKMNPKSISIVSKGLDISNKIGFINFGPESSKLNSIVQIITSIKEINNIFNAQKNIDFKKFNHIYILSSLFFEIINGINNKIKISLKPMDIIIKFLNSDTAPKDLADYLKVILQNLHNELIPFPGNTNNENLISYNSPFQDKQQSLNIFNNYYTNNYKKSIISDLFNWTLLRKINCNQKYYTCSFQTYPLIIFNIDILFKIQHSNNVLTFDLINCFMNYSKLDNNDVTDACMYCGNMHFSNHFIFTTPPYFIIILNRADLNEVRIKYSSELDISNYVEENAQYRKYKLIGVIMEKQNNYYSIIKNEKEGDFGNKEEWKKYQDENVSTIIINTDIKDKISQNEVYDPINARILFYRGIIS